MSRISNCLAAVKKNHKKALIPYITAGDPSADISLALMHALVCAGADIIELGVPFSDPMADGPIIQRAAERALQHHFSLRQVLQLVKQFRATDLETPVVLMGYLNPLEIMGIESFCESAQDVGVDGVLTVDMPPEEAQEWISALIRKDIDPIFLIAPTTDAARITLISDSCRGYLYYVAVKGTTGAGNLDVTQVTDKLAQIRKLSKLPVAVGFGIKDAVSANAIAAIADAVVVGSAVIQRVEQNLSDSSKIVAEVKSFIQSLRTAMDNVNLNRAE
ncbi:MAG: tryptophan synthase subunit alpha [Thiohalomonadales bacterium]